MIRLNEAPLAIFAISMSTIAFTLAAVGAISVLRDPAPSPSPIPAATWIQDGKFVASSGSSAVTTSPPPMLLVDAGPMLLVDDGKWYADPDLITFPASNDACQTPVVAITICPDGTVAVPRRMTRTEQGRAFWRAVRVARPEVCR